MMPGVNKKSVNLKGGEKMKWKQEMLRRLIWNKGNIYRMHFPRRFGKTEFCEEALKTIIDKHMKNPEEQMKILVVQAFPQGLTHVFRRLRDYFTENYGGTVETSSSARFATFKHQNLFIRFEARSLFEEFFLQYGRIYTYDYIFYDDADSYSQSYEVLRRYIRFNTDDRPHPTVCVLGTKNTSLMLYFDKHKDEFPNLRNIYPHDEDAQEYRILLHHLPFSYHVAEETINHPSLKIANRYHKNVLELV